jgi:hypothetical protein
MVVASAALVVVVTLLVRVATADAPATAPTPTVSYPAVSGPIGDDLTRLEHAVDPGRTP